MGKPTYDEYIAFLESKILGFGLPKLSKYYESVVYAMKQTFEESEFLKELSNSLAEYNQEFIQLEGYSLFSRIEPIEIKVKPFESMLMKCYRKDVLENEQWNEEAFDLDSMEKHVNPARCFEEFSDILRTRLSVRYLDGAIFLLDKVNSLADKFGLNHSHAYKAEEKGYYAIHVDFRYPFEILSEEFEPRKIESKIEMQINTEIQNMILDLTHKYYEEKRSRRESIGDKWQWDYDCDEFIPNYLGHIIHYIEGMIMEVRKRKRKEISE